MNPGISNYFNLWNLILLDAELYIMSRKDVGKFVTTRQLQYYVNTPEQSLRHIREINPQISDLFNFMNLP